MDVVFLGALILMGVTLRLVTLKEMLEGARLRKSQLSHVAAHTR